MAERPEQPESPPTVGESPPLAGEQVLHDDYHLVVVNKPAPLLTQAPAGILSLEAMVKAYIKQTRNKPGGVYLGIPHRLDRPVSGVVAFALNTKAAQRIHAQFERREVRKVYWAAVEGSIDADSGTWEDWVRKVKEEARTVRATPEEPGAKLARLDFRVLQRFAGGTLVELAPQTGRMHQLRVQSAWRGHPVFGDVMYGSVREFGPAWENPRDKVIALHARTLTITHPVTREPLTCTASLPAYWQALGIARTGTA
ncbi:MAG: RluA family pseudouridine synthase [Bacteroidales bacterium]|nr:RluA family pseudouridine synthase [Bacteroidales bacterium]